MYIRQLWTHDMTRNRYGGSRKNLIIAAPSESFFGSDGIEFLSTSSAFSSCPSLRVGPYLPRLGRITQMATTRHPAIRPALARTPFWNPTRPLKRLLSIIGCSVPPSDDPLATMLMTSARRWGFLKYCASSAIDGTYERPEPAPTPIACARKTWMGNEHYYPRSSTGIPGSIVVAWTKRAWIDWKHRWQNRLSQHCN